MPKETQSKEEIYFAVCNAILKLELAKGHLKWTLTDVARESGITRTLIYYYFGKEKQTVLDVAYKFVISHFYDMDRMKTLALRERLEIILRELKNMPYLLMLFYQAKGDDSEFGRLIRKKETEFLKILAGQYPHLTETQVLEIYLLELGAMLFHLPPAQAKELFSLYSK
jgi:AcrR family transcriptional regulator